MGRGFKGGALTVARRGARCSSGPLVALFRSVAEARFQTCCLRRGAGVGRAFGHAAPAAGTWLGGPSQSMLYGTQAGGGRTMAAFVESCRFAAP